MAADLPPPAEPTKRILPAEGHRLQGSFGTIVVRLQAAMLEIGPQLAHADQGVADCLGQLRLAGDPGQLGGEPGLQPIEDRLGPFPTVTLVANSLGLISWS